MRIGIDGGCWSNQRGYGRFLREVVGALGAARSGHEYLVFLDPASYETFPDLPAVEPVVVQTRHTITQAAAANNHRSVRDVLRMTQSVFRTNLDVFFFPSVYTYFPLLGKLPMVVCIHDTIPERNPSEHFDSWRQSWAWKMKVGAAVFQSSCLVTVSEYSKRCLCEHLRVPETKIRVVYEAAAPEFRVGDEDVDNRGRPYILYVGGFSPHKNLHRLVRAFHALKPRFPELRLVLAGNYKTDSFKGSYPSLARLVSELGIDADVEFPGFVPDADLPGLYRGASVVALPSFDEGFGLPALEAMACGVPVVVSSGNAMEEIVGGAGLVVNPHETEELSAAIGRILTDRALEQRLRHAGPLRAREFSWERSAGQLLEVFGEFESASS